MGYRDLFNVYNKSGPGRSAAGGAGGGGAPVHVERQGAFVTPQSLTSFAGASGVVVILWKATGLLNPAWPTASGAAFVCAFLVGAFLFYISESDPARGQLTMRDYVTDAFVGFVNILVLFSAAVGGTAVVGNAV